MAELVERTYAQALFDIAVEENKLDVLKEEITFVLDAFSMYPDFYNLYNTPQISKDEKKKIIEEVFKEKISTEMMNFLKILLDKRRTNCLKGIAKVFKKLLNDYKNMIEGTVTTAVPLKDEEKLRIENKLSIVTGKKIKLENMVDPSIIGGVLVKIGDKVIDGSLESRLTEMQKDLAQILV
ncbi:F0F1 ATP synthase subunit delta [Crassaminicella profunda]|uniref:F0F1 ATP synthase subunit delta n=1 Tax=Crassaminicella profunda TaxID=1286698 RepID=UPI001CA6659E|nr:F0F1 ATP synthase subunit delta [Crassaminicella profunda]QZY55524.1 F0F1 ATP synthase subunit delta [Crassaminicella profunda]